MTTNEIKAMDARCLNEYLSTLPNTDHRFFVSAVVEACGNGIKRKTFYNWKAEIERLAGRTVFPKELYVDSDDVAAQSIHPGDEPEIS